MKISEKNIKKIENYLLLKNSVNHKEMTWIRIRIKIKWILCTARKRRYLPFFNQIKVLQVHPFLFYIESIINNIPCEEEKEKCYNLVGIVC